MGSLIVISLLGYGTYIRSHGSLSTRRVIRGGKNQISGNQRVSVRRTDCVHEGQIHSTDHLLFRSALNLETESAGRARRRRPRHRWWMGLASNSFVYTCPRAPFPQLNNCIHIHPSVRPSVRPLREIRNDGRVSSFPIPQPFRPLPPSLAISLANQTRHRKISPRSNLRSNCTSTTRSAELARAQAAKRRIRDVWSEVIALGAMEGIPDDLHARDAQLRQFFALSGSAYPSIRWNELYIHKTSNQQYPTLDNWFPEKYTSSRWLEINDQMFNWNLSRIMFL